MADIVAQDLKEVNCFLKGPLNSCVNKKSTDFIELTESGIQSLSKSNKKRRDIFSQLTLSAKNIVHKDILLEYTSKYHIKRYLRLSYQVD